jgi:biopolymer transport protein ExbB
VRRSLIILFASACRFYAGDAGSDDAPANGSDAVAAGWWDSQWTRRNLVEVDTDGLTESLTSFPVLVELTATNFDYAAASANGNDLRFVDADGKTALNYDIDEFHSGGTSIVWVDVDLSAGSPHPMFWLYYGNPAAVAASAPARVWSDYVSVHHLVNLEDASGNGHTGSAVGTPTTTASGMLGSGQSFTEAAGSQSAIALDDPNSHYDLTTGLTASVWIKTSTAFSQQWQAFLTKGDNAWRLQRDGQNAGAVFGTSPTAGGFDDLADDARTVDDGNWHQIVGVFDPRNGKSIYVDGGSAVTDSSNTLSTTTDPTWIGDNFTFNTRSFQGRIDEVRVSTMLRGAAWIDFEYAMITRGLVTLQPTMSL